MDFSVLKSEEKIKPFTNYIGPSQQKFSPTSPFNKEAELKNEILFKENQTLIEYPKEKSYNNVNVPIESRFSSYDINLKLGDKTGQAARSNENLMGEKGVKINLTDIIFKNENEFTSQDICKICELSLSKLSGDKKNCAICGLTVCKTCSSRKVNENRVCDLCFLKVKSAASEIRRKDFLNVTLNRKEDMKANIVIGKGQLDSLSKEINKMTEKNYSDEISNANSLTDMQLKLDQLKEKQNLIISKFHVVLKNYEKKKELQKEIQEKYNEKQKINHFILNCINNKKQIYLSKFDEFCKLQNHKVELENSDLYKTIVKELENIKVYKDKSKNFENEESNHTMSNYNNPSYDDRKPSILDEKDYNFAAPKTNNKSLINQENLNNSLSSRINNEELFCDNSCTGSFFAYHKQKKELK